MKLTTDENGEIILEEVYSGVGLKTRDGEFMGICMRDSGFEFNYQGEWYEAKNGIVRKMKMNSDFDFLETEEYKDEKIKNDNHQPSIKRGFKSGDKVEIVGNIPFQLKDKPKPLLGRVISVDGFYVYVKPLWQRWEGEWYKNELRLYVK